MISIASCIDYIECSYKGKYAALTPRLDVHHAKVVALADTAKYFLMRAGENKTTTLRGLRQRMSTAWDKTKKLNSFSYDWKDLISVQEQLTKVHRLVTPSDAVVAINYPVSFRPLRVVEGQVQTVEVTGTVDGIVLKNQDSSKRYLQVLLFDYTAFAARSNKSSLLRFLAGLYDLALRDAKISRMPRRYSFLRVHNGNVQSVTVKRYKDEKVLAVLTKIMTGIHHDIMVPTTDNRTCKDCLHRQVCDWYQE